MAYQTILYDVADNILTITLNRPEKLNAFTREMMLEMIDAFDKADADDNIRAIIVTGSGRGFCAGADLSAGAATFDRTAQPDAAPSRAASKSEAEIDWPEMRMWKPVTLPAASIPAVSLACVMGW